MKPLSNMSIKELISRYELGFEEEKNSVILELCNRVIRYEFAMADLSRILVWYADDQLEQNPERRLEIEALARYIMKNQKERDSINKED